MKGAVLFQILSKLSGFTGRKDRDRTWQQCHIHTFADKQAQHRKFCCGVDLKSYFNWLIYAMSSLILFHKNWRHVLLLHILYTHVAAKSNDRFDG
jgi:hypothetical protein